MLYNLVERAKFGGKQINRVSLPITLNASRWESTKHLLARGQISKDIATKYHSITDYTPIDWVEEEANITHNGPYSP